MSVSSVNKINSVNATQEVFKIEDVSKTANSQAIKLNNDVNNENMSDENQQAAGANAVNATTEKLREISNALVGFNKSPFNRLSTSRIETLFCNDRIFG